MHSDNKLHISNSTISWHSKREPGLYLPFDTADGGRARPHKYLRFPHGRKKCPTYTEECPKLGNWCWKCIPLQITITSQSVPKPSTTLICTLAASLLPGLDNLSMVLLMWNELNDKTFKFATALTGSKLGIWKVPVFTVLDPYQTTRDYEFIACNRHNTATTVQKSSQKRMPETELLL